MKSDGEIFEDMDRIREESSGEKKESKKWPGNSSRYVPLNFPLPKPLGGPAEGGAVKLMDHNEVFVDENVDVLKVVIGLNVRKQFNVMSSAGEVLYLAVDARPTVNVLHGCTQCRHIHMRLIDPLGFDCAIITRNCGYTCLFCDWFCWTCKKYELEVQTPPGEIAGYVKERASCLRPAYTVEDADNNMKYKINGPNYNGVTPRCSSQLYPIVDNNGNEVGSIIRYWPGWYRDCLGFTVKFSLSFPNDCNLQTRTSLLGCGFFICYNLLVREYQAINYTPTSDYGANLQL